MSSPYEDAQKLMGAWTEMAARMAAAGMCVDPGSPPSEATKQIRGAVFDAISQQAQQFMRSPQFMQMVKQSLDASIAFRKQMNRLLTDTHHAFQDVACQDVDNLQLVLRHLEHRTLDRMDELAEKLERLDQRLEAMEKKNHSGANDEWRDNVRANV